MKFKVKGPLHVYITPNHGRVDLRKPLDDQKGLALYKDASFPYLELTKLAIPLLKKEKLSDLKAIVEQASIEDLRILDTATSNKALKARIKDRISILTKDI